MANEDNMNREQSAIDVAEASERRLRPTLFFGVKAFHSGVFPVQIARKSSRRSEH